MVKEDIWGNKTMLVRMRKDELFGETFACGSDNLSVVTFLVSEDAQILFMPFDRVMHSCTIACVFHHRLIENMVAIIANKNRDLMRKVEVVSKRTIWESCWHTFPFRRRHRIPATLRSPLAEWSWRNTSALTGVL